MLRPRGEELPAFDAVVQGRRSVRRYQARAVSDEVLREIVDLARCAPSSMNGQPCVFVVIRDRGTLARLVELKNRHCPPQKSAYPADFIAAASAVVAVCVERSRSNGRERENGVLATGFLLLAAHSRGLSGVFLTSYQNDDPALAEGIRALLRLPADVEPVTLVPLGYPAEPPPPKTLRPLDEIIHAEAIQ